LRKKCCNSLWKRVITSKRGYRIDALLVELLLLHHELSESLPRIFRIQDFHFSFFCFRFSGFGFRVSVFGFRIRFPVSGLGFRIFGFRFQISVFVVGTASSQSFQTMIPSSSSCFESVTCSAFRISNVGLRVPGSRFRFWFLNPLRREEMRLQGFLDEAETKPCVFRNNVQIKRCVFPDVTGMKRREFPDETQRNGACSRTRPNETVRVLRRADETSGVMKKLWISSWLKGSGRGCFSWSTDAIT